MAYQMPHYGPVWSFGGALSSMCVGILEFLDSLAVLTETTVKRRR